MTDDEFAERLKRQILDAYGFDEAPWEEQASTAGDPTTAEDERVTWLLRQIAYEEGGARQASTYAAATWTCISTGVLEYGLPGDSDAWPITLNDGGITQHIADHDPARVLRDVRAKRALLADILSLREIAPAVADRMLLCMLASYQGEHGWRDEWRVPGLDDDGTPRILDGEIAAKELT
jgi:hypothetical protein